MAWYAVLTRPRSEAVATHGLRAAGYTAVYPLERIQRRAKRRGGTVIVWTDQPYFPRYVFLAARPDQALAPVSATRGVAALVCRPLSGIPLTIPDPVMAEILNRRLVALDDGSGALVMAETFIRGDDALRVFVNELGKWRTERTSLDA